MLSVACVTLGTFGVVVGALNRVWSASFAAVFVVAQFALPGDRTLDVVQAALMACYVALAWWVRGGAR